MSKIKTIILEDNDISNHEEREDLALGNAMVQEETGEYITAEDLLKEL